jgi:hypothetical protein
MTYYVTYVHAVFTLDNSLLFTVTKLLQRFVGMYVYDQSAYQIYVQLQLVDLVTGVKLKAKQISHRLHFVVLRSTKKKKKKIFSEGQLP